MKSLLYVGSSYEVVLPKTGCLFITRDFLKLPDARHPRYFDWQENAFNPFYKLDYPRRCAIVDIFDALSPEGATTLTKQMGLDYIADVLETEPKNLQEFDDRIPPPDKKSLPGHVWAYTKVRRIMRSPVLSKALGSQKFTFKKGSMNQVRVGGLVRFDALALSLFATSQFDGQIVIPEFTFARDFHTQLIDEGRLIAGVRRLSQLKGEVYDAAMSMEIEPRGCIYKDAVTLAEREGLHQDFQREDNPYNRFIAQAMA